MCGCLCKLPGMTQIKAVHNRVYCRFLLPSFLDLEKLLGARYFK